jgi:hypothetical protein
MMQNWKILKDDSIVESAQVDNMRDDYTKAVNSDLRIGMLFKERNCHTMH